MIPTVFLSVIKQNYMNNKILHPLSISGVQAAHKYNQTNLVHYPDISYRRLVFPLSPSGKCDGFHFIRETYVSEFHF